MLYLEEDVSWTLLSTASNRGWSFGQLSWAPENVTAPLILQQGRAVVVTSLAGSSTCRSLNYSACYEATLSMLELHCGHVTR